MYLVCGEALYDIFVEREERAGNLFFQARSGGSPFNVAIGVARLGGQTALFTGMSNDMLGERLRQILQSESVCTDYLVRSNGRTTLSLVGVDSLGQPSYVFYGLGSADCNLTLDDLPDLGAKITGLHFGSYSLVVHPGAEGVARLSANANDRFV